MLGRETDKLTMLFLVLLSLCQRTLSERDSNAYTTGGVQNSMYWRDATNVIEDLSMFSKLYVQFHNCAWSPYDDSDNDGTCGEMTDDQFWYMGATECFRANAAFSLYGILSGKEDLGCEKRTFINSFFTNTGVETFTQALSSAGLTFQSSSNDYNNADGYPGGVSSQCTYQEGNNNNKNNNNDDSTSHNQKYGAGYTSYGLGCSKNTFAMMQFKGSFCHTEDYVKVTDKLTAFNSDLSQASCVPIYVSGGGNANNNDNNNNNNNGNSPLNLLYYSSACSVREFPNSCPDPYGKLVGYARADERMVAKAVNPKQERLKMIFSWVLLGLGAAMLLFSLYVYLRRVRRARLKAAAKEEALSKRKWFPRASKADVEVPQPITETEPSPPPNPCQRMFVSRPKMPRWSWPKFSIRRKNQEGGS